jgi:hypothetical protein
MRGSPLAKNQGLPLIETCHELLVLEKQGVAGTAEQRPTIDVYSPGVEITQLL